jgi:hypothetical protein
VSECQEHQVNLAIRAGFAAGRASAALKMAPQASKRPEKSALSPQSGVIRGMSVQKNLRVKKISNKALKFLQTRVSYICHMSDGAAYWP